MAITVNCPHCSSRLTTDDSKAGLRAKCPKCGGFLEIPRLPRPAADDVLEAELDAPRAFDDDDLALEAPVPRGGSEAAARKQCPMCGEMIAAAAVKCRFCGEVLDKSMRGVLGGGGASDPGWMGVRSGVALMYNCIVVLFVTVVLLVICGVIMAAMSDGRDPFGADPSAGLAVLMIIAGLVILGAGLGALIGQVKCTAAPESSGARGFAVSSIVCLALYIILAIAGSASQTPALNALGGLLQLIGSVLFILFIRRSGEALGDRDLASSAGRYLIFGVLLFVGAFVLGFVAAAAQAPPLLAVLGIVVFVCAIIAFIWYLRLLKGLMRAIDGPGRLR